MATREQELTIDELARETGLTVRSIRAHQSRGLLPPPEVRARTGYYGVEHVARLRLIREMQADGFNLTAIKRLLDRAPATSEEILGFREALRAPFEREQPIIMTGEELAERTGGAPSERAIKKAERLGIIVPLGDGNFEVTSPTLLKAGERAIEVGVPLEAALALVERVTRHAESAAEAFVKFFLEEIWRPFESEGQPTEGWPRIQAALDELRPQAAETLLAAFGPAMSRAVESALQKEIRRDVKRAGG